LALDGDVLSASSSRHILPLRKEPTALSNIRLDGHHTYNGYNIPMHGDQQVKLNTLI
jgi:hypothetical protein